jgi:hypothetical protein
MVFSYAQKIADVEFDHITPARLRCLENSDEAAARLKLSQLAQRNTATVENTSESLPTDMTARSGDVRFSPKRHYTRLGIRA